MMAQYLEIRARHPGCLLWYRMGDFYELFFEDAERAAEALDIALTRRGRHEGAEVPMCGVPAHNADGYLLALIRKGFRVAVAEQLETPEEARAAGRKLVRRDVVRVVTPGTLTEDALLDARRHNYLASVAAWGGRAAVAWADVSTGAFAVQGCAAGEVGEALARLSPSEVLVAPGAPGAEGAQAVERPGLSAEVAGAARRLAAWFGVATLDGFGAFDAHEVAALLAVTDYLDLTQKGARAHLRPPTREDAGECMAIDAGTCASLEIMAGPGGGRAGSLLAAVDRTVTAAGGRLLVRRLGAPSRRLDVVNARLDAVAAMAPRPVRAALRGAPDLDRALGRLAVGRGTPRDLAAIRDGLHVAGAVAGALPPALPPLLETAARDLAGLDALRDRLTATLAPEPPAQGEGAVAPGASAHLDALRTLRDDARGAVASLQARYASLAGVPSLKVRHNGTLGFFVETTATHAERMLKAPLDATFIHRQTTANLLRFTTLELGELERRIAGAAEEAEALEARLVGELRDAALAEADALGRLAAALARSTWLQRWRTSPPRSAGCAPWWTPRARS
jgi:DNA mismatch repair protein MutS